MVKDPENPVIFWFRSDLRLADNPGLAAAVETGAPIVPVYILDDDSAGDWQRGGASRWWLYHSLSALDQALQKAGFHPLVYLQGDARKVLPQFFDDIGAGEIYWNRCYEPWAIARDTELKKKLPAHSFNAYLMFEPWEIKNKTGGSYKVFTPFYRTCLERGGIRPPITGKLKPRQLEKIIKRLVLKELGLIPSIKWYTEIEKAWQPGEAGAHARLKHFTADGVSDYRAQRDFPAIDGVSQLSPHLHFGEISPHQIWHAASGQKNADAFLRQIIWREFSYHLLYHSPDFPDQPWNKQFRKFPWLKNAAALKRWQKGMTGYPIVDAGMRQLWRTGWMHNRVRMIVGSFLVKNLLIDWREGEKWFWDTLVDADLGNNAAGWQWIAGCGADASPYFRIFNPVTQSEKFDPKGEYIRHFVPELKNLPDKYLHAPWEAPPLVRKGINYPSPIVDLSASRDRALEAYGVSKNALR